MLADRRIPPIISRYQGKDVTAQFIPSGETVTDEGMHLLSSPSLSSATIPIVQTQCKVLRENIHSAEPDAAVPDSLRQPVQSA